MQLMIVEDIRVGALSIEALLGEPQERCSVGQGLLVEFSCGRGVHCYVGTLHLAG